MTDEHLPYIGYPDRMPRTRAEWVSLVSFMDDLVLEAERKIGALSERVADLDESFRSLRAAAVTGWKRVRSLEEVHGACCQTFQVRVRWIKEMFRELSGLPEGDLLAIWGRERRRRGGGR